MKSHSPPPLRQRRYSRSPSEDGGRREGEYCCVLVTNLPRDVRAAEAERLVDEFGRIASMPVIDRLRSGAEAIAEFCDPRDARAAVNCLDGTLYCGRRIRVSLVAGLPGDTRGAPVSPKWKGEKYRDDWGRSGRYGSRSPSGAGRRDYRRGDWGRRRMSPHDRNSYSPLYSPRQARPRGEATGRRDYSPYRRGSRDDPVPFRGRSRSPSNRGRLRRPRSSPHGDYSPEAVKRRSQSLPRCSGSPKRCSMRRAQCSESPARRDPTPGSQSISPRSRSTRRSVSPKKSRLSGKPRSISPDRRSIGARRRSMSPGGRSPIPKPWSPSPGERSGPSPARRSVSPKVRRLGKRRHGSSSINRRSIGAASGSRSPVRRGRLSPQRRSRSPRRRSISPKPTRRSISPGAYNSPTPQRSVESPKRRSMSRQSRSVSRKRSSPSPKARLRNTSRAQSSASPPRRRSCGDVSPGRRDVSPSRRDVSPSRREASPKRRSPGMRSRSASQRPLRGLTPEGRREGSRSPSRRRSPGIPEGRERTTRRSTSATGRARSNSAAVREPSPSTNRVNRSPSKQKDASSVTAASGGSRSRRSSFVDASNTAVDMASADADELKDGKLDDDKGEATAGGTALSAAAPRVSKWRSRWGVSAPPAGSPSPAVSGAASDTAGAAGTGFPPSAADTAAATKATERTAPGGPAAGGSTAAFPFQKASTILPSSPASIETPGAASDTNRAAEKYLGTLEAKPKIKIVLSRTGQQQQRQQRATASGSRDDSDAVSAAALAEAYLLAAAETEEAAAAAGEGPQEAGLSVDAAAPESEPFASSPSPVEAAESAEKREERRAGSSPKNAEGSDETTDALSNGEPTEANPEAGPKKKECEAQQDAGDPPTWRRPHPPPIPAASNEDTSPVPSSRSSRASPAIITLASALEAHSLQSAKEKAAAANSGDEGSPRSGGAGNSSNMFRRRRLGREGVVVPRKQVSEEDVTAPPPQRKDVRRRSPSSSRSRRGSIDCDSREHDQSERDYRGREDYRRSPPHYPRGPRGDRWSRERERERDSGYYRYGPPQRTRDRDWRAMESARRGPSRGYNDRWDKGPWRRRGGSGYRRERWDFYERRRSRSGTPRAASRDDDSRDGKNSRTQRRSRSRSSRREEVKERRKRSPSEVSASRYSAGPRDTRRYSVEERSPPAHGGKKRIYPEPLRDHLVAREDSLSPKEKSPIRSLSPEALRHTRRASRTSPVRRRSASVQERKQVKPTDVRDRSTSPHSASPRGSHVSPPRQPKGDILGSPVRDSSQSPPRCGQLPPVRRGSVGSTRSARTLPRDRRTGHEMPRRSPAPVDAGTAGRRERRIMPRRSRSPSPAPRGYRSKRSPGAFSPERSQSSIPRDSFPRDRRVPARGVSPHRAPSNPRKGPALQQESGCTARDHRGSSPRERRPTRSPSQTQRRSASRSIGSCRSKGERQEEAQEPTSYNGRWQQRGRSSRERSPDSPGRAIYDKEMGRASAYKRSGRMPSVSASPERSSKRFKGKRTSKDSCQRWVDDDARMCDTHDRGYSAVDSKHRNTYRPPSRGRSSRSPSPRRRSWGRYRGNRPY